MSILTVENLSKNYGNIQALKNVSFSVPEGTVFGILGPNGSGKT
ncbi:MAG: ATP-binding cassette domain-containing protein, partial [Ginsengibacter sp.]